jgi:HlyD family secretion protein
MTKNAAVDAARQNRALANDAYYPDGVRRAMIAGVAVAALLVGGVGVWGSQASLAGAIMAGGVVVVDSSVKKVQHPTGGVVGEIRVQDGDRVRRGDLLVRLDETLVRSNLQIVSKQLDELAIRQARLKAERDGADFVETPGLLAERMEEPEVAVMVADERGLFESRQKSRAGQTAQLQQRIGQLNQEIQGMDAQQQAKSSEIGLVQKELEGADTLWRQNLMPITKLTALQREASRLEGERGQLIAQTAQVRGKISETELQILQVGQDLRTEVLKELRDAQGKEAELAERRVAAEDQLKHVDIRAPQSGVVHQLSAHTVGGVVAQGEAIMMIVPEGDALVIEAKIAPQDIDHVRRGQSSFIRFSAFDQRTTPEFEGVVDRVAADLTRDQQGGQAYYLARVILTDSSQLGNSSEKLTLIPGMPAEIHIRTSERTALSYFIKPLRDQMSRAFIER